MEVNNEQCCASCMYGRYKAIMESNDDDEGIYVIECTNDHSGKTTVREGDYCPFHELPF